MHDEMEIKRYLIGITPSVTFPDLLVNLKKLNDQNSYSVTYYVIV